MSVAIDAANAGDVDRVLAVERQAFSDPWSRESFVRVLANPAVFFGCARRADDSELLGYVVAWFAADEAEIANLAVAPAFHGTGIGRRLLDSALAEARARGARTVYLEVRDSNARARRLYGSRGFEEIGRRRRYYRKPEEDAIVLRRRLDEDETEMKWTGPGAFRESPRRIDR